MFGGAGDRADADLCGASVPQISPVAGRATIGAFAGYVSRYGAGCSRCSLPALGIAYDFVAAGLVGAVADEFVLKPFQAAGVDRHGDRVGGADDRARKHRAVRVRQRFARLDLPISAD